MGPAKNKLAVAILNYNGRKVLETFLPSVITAIDEKFPIYIIDNQSTDESVSFLETNFPNLHIIINEENCGYAQGYNQGLKKIEAEYYLLVNSDIEFPKNFSFEKILNNMDENKNLVAVQPKILSYNQKDTFEYAGAAGGLMDFFGFPFCYGRIKNRVEKDTGKYDDKKEIFWASGACFFIKQKPFWKAKGFDEDFYLHLEEIDLCWRLKNMGYKLEADNSEKVYHLGGGTLEYQSPFKLYLNLRNSLFMVIKNADMLSVFRIFCFRGLTDIGFAMVSFLSLKPKKGLAVFKSHFHFLKSLPKMWNKRIQFQKQYKIKSMGKLSGVEKKSIIFA